MISQNHSNARKIHVAGGQVIARIIVRPKSTPAAWTASCLLLAVLAVGCTVPQEPKPELAARLREADREDPQALFRLGQEYFERQEYEKAAAVWKLAAAQGVLAAYSNLGVLTYYGLGVDKNPEEGIRLWQYAAHRGFAEAHRHLGTAYAEGKYLPRDPQEAYARFRAALLLAAKSSAPWDTRVAIRAAAGLKALRNELSQSQIDKAEAQAILYVQHISDPTGGCYASPNLC